MERDRRGVRILQYGIFCTMVIGGLTSLIGALVKDVKGDAAAFHNLISLAVIMLVAAVGFVVMAKPGD